MVFLKLVQKLWNKWELRGCVLFSLLLQALLIFLAPLRKRKPQKSLIMIIWFAYLAADSVAIFSLGLISQSQGHKGSSPSESSSSKMKQDVLALWAPFLLLHLGGPDTITAFALEDNELWIRHLANLLMQSLGAGYIFFQSFPNNTLWLPTCFMFVVGLIKYAERTAALYLASMKSFRDSLLPKPDPGPNYAKLMDEYSWMTESGLPAKIEMTKEPEIDIGEKDFSEEGFNTHDPVLIVEKAYDFFNTFKGLIVDLIFSFHERDNTRNFFLKITKPEEAFRLIEIELSFIYDVLYTKASIVHSRIGCIFRFIGFFFTFVALILIIIKKDEMHDIDTNVTLALFSGAISLELVALVMLISSDWTIALLMKSSRYSVSKFLTKNICFNKTRWSGSISEFNLINFCLCKRPEWMDSIVNKLRLTDIVDEIQYTSRNPFDKELKGFIFDELKWKSESAEGSKATKKICSSRGNWILSDSRPDDPLIREKLDKSFEVEYDESLLWWHIATDLLYHTDDENTQNNHTDEENTQTNHTDKENTPNYRKFCKVLSDYMLYLLVIQPTVVSSIASIAQIRYNDTCADAEKFFGRLEPESTSCSCIPRFKLKATDEQLKKACQRLLDVKTIVDPADVKGDRSKSVLFDAVILAQHLQKWKVNEKWKIMSQVWVELLCYAASHCRVNTHAQQLRSGGELVTLLWLLMVQFGLGDQFRIEAGHGRAKLVVADEIS